MRRRCRRTSGAPGPWIWVRSRRGPRHRERDSPRGPMWFRCTAERGLRQVWTRCSGYSARRLLCHPGCRGFWTRLGREDESGDRPWVASRSGCSCKWRCCVRMVSCKSSLECVWRIRGRRDGFGRSTERYLLQERGPELRGRELSTTL